jgi:hypothetical protein
MSKVTSGEKNGMYGKTFYEVLVKKFGKTIADIKFKEMKEKISKKGKGRKLSEEHKQKISTSHKGIVSPMLGKHYSIKTKNKINEYTKSRKCIK